MYPAILDKTVSKLIYVNFKPTQKWFCAWNQRSDVIFAVLRHLLKTIKCLFYFNLAF